MPVLRARKLFRESGRLLIAVEQVKVAREAGPPFAWLSVRLEPVALVVCSREGSRALDLQSRPLGLGQLRATVSGLEVMLSAFEAEPG